MKAKKSIIPALIALMFFVQDSFGRSKDDTHPDPIPLFGQNAEIDSLNAMPSQLVRFSIDTSGSSVKVTWFTRRERRNSYFVIQRSTDGKEYENVIWIEGEGSRKGETLYSVVDSEAHSGISYYRIMQTDSKGNFISLRVGVVRILSNNTSETLVN
jgi:hypothetical protein